MGNIGLFEDLGREAVLPACLHRTVDRVDDCLKTVALTWLPVIGVAGHCTRLGSKYARVLVVARVCCDI